MKIVPFLVLLGFVAANVVTSPRADAAQVSISNSSPPFPIVGLPNDRIDAGEGFVMLGAFPGLLNADIMSMSMQFDLIGLNDAFEPFGDQIEFATPDANSVAGFFRDEVGAAIGAGSPLVGEDIFLVAGEGGSFSSATTLGIVRFAEQFQLDNPVFGATLDLAEGDVVVGRVFPATIEINGQTLAFDSLCTNCIPEPGASSLLLITICGFVLRRRVRG